MHFDHSRQVIQLAILISNFGKTEKLDKKWHPLRVERRERAFVSLPERPPMLFLASGYSMHVSCCFLNDFLWLRAREFWVKRVGKAYI